MVIEFEVKKTMPSYYKDGKTQKSLYLLGTMV